MGISVSSIIGIVVSHDVDDIFTGHGESTGVVGFGGQITKGAIDQLEPMARAADTILAADGVAVDSDGGVIIGHSKGVSQGSGSVGVQHPVLVDVFARVQVAIRNPVSVRWVDDVFKPVLADYGGGVRFGSGNMPRRSE